MTISSALARQVLLGDGVTTEFTFQIVAGQASWVVATLTNQAGVQTILAQGTAYTLYINPAAAGALWGVGGVVTYPISGSPMSVGESLTIQRIVPNTQLVSIQNQGNFYPQATEQMGDVLCLETQGVSDIASRAVVGNVADVGVSYTLPPVVSRAGKLLSFDGGGNVTVSSVASPIFVKPNPLAPSQPASSLPNLGSITTAFNCDLTECFLPVSIFITGSTTLGVPTGPTWGQLNPQFAATFTYLTNYSGANYLTNNQGGRTQAMAHYTKVDNFGQGDAGAYSVNAFVDGALPGATSWLANPAGFAYYAGMFGGQNGVYLNPVEITNEDQGFDVAAINFVANGIRTVNTAALGENWISFRAQSGGTAPMDAIISASGLFTIGLDFTAATFGTNKGAIVLAPNQGIFFGGTNATSFPLGTNPTGPNIISISGQLNLVNGTDQVQVGPTSITHLDSTYCGGSILTLTDNAYTCGGSGARWSAIWAANGTIQTSDPSLKTDIAPVPEAMPIIRKLLPKTYRWKVGGQDTKKRAQSDGHGADWFDVAPRAGKRTHWGFMAPDVKEAFAGTGLDFGGYVKAEDGTEALRPDQLIPVLCKGIQELDAQIGDVAGLAAQVATLTARLNKMVAA